jgi:hypothetical protein
MAWVPRKNATKNTNPPWLLFIKLIRTTLMLGHFMRWPSSGPPSMAATSPLICGLPRYLKKPFLNTQHPGVVHYLIHSYDDPIHAPLGLRAARIYARLAPDAGHAQHMTSHIFLALGMWEDVVKANETAIAVVNRERAAASRPARGCGHYPYWLEYGYLQLGRVDDARRVLVACRQEALRQAERNSGSNNPTADPDPAPSVHTLQCAPIF